VSTTEDSEILDAIERWVEKEVRPIARQFDHADEYPVAAGACGHIAETACGAG
jgi:alkylation response protein AidB-like acyl-CoA dehydrogenase